MGKSTIELFGLGYINQMIGLGGASASIMGTGIHYEGIKMLVYFVNTLEELS